jgi:hypothetical protein
VEVNAYVQSAIQRAGIAALASGEADTPLRLTAPTDDQRRDG